MRIFPALQVIGIPLLAIGAGLALAKPAAAQQTASVPVKPAVAPSGPATVESDPIRCWLKTSKAAIHVGEQFSLALTCGVVETNRVSVVVDTSQIEPASIQLAPFEVLSGVRHPDIRAGMWRYYQYEYTLRLITDEFFGQDLAVPPVNLEYRVSLSDGIANQQGMQKRYVLPTLPLRLISLVPQTAADIRDAPRGTFADIEARRFRGTVGFVGAAIAFAFAALMLLLAAARAAGRLRERMPKTDRGVAATTIAQASLGVLNRIAADTGRSGWSLDAVGRALGALRIAAALALSHPIAQTRVNGNVAAREGQLVLRQGVLRPQHVLVSASSTPGALTMGPASRTVLWAGGARATLDEIGTALKDFSEASYGRETQLDVAALDRALAQGRNALRRLRIHLSWPMRTAEDIARWSASRWGWAWVR